MVPFVSALALLLGSIHGTVMRGPITPVCRAGVPCNTPAAHEALIFKGVGKTWGTSTDAKGRYRIVLAAGVYTVRTAVKYGKAYKPGKVRVIANRDRRVNLLLDTGIR